MISERNIRLCRNAALIFIPLSLVFGGMLLLILITEMHSDLKVLKSGEHSRVDQIFSAVSKDYAFISSDLLALSQMREMKKMIEGDFSTLHQLEQDLLSFSGVKRIYDQLRYLDEAGQEIVRVNYTGGQPRIVPAAELQNKSDRYYFQKTLALNQGEIYLSPLDLNVEQGVVETPWKPMIRIATPVFTDKGEKKGAVVMNLHGETILRNFPQSQSKTEAHTCLLNPQGYWLKAPDPTLEWGFMFEDRKDRNLKNQYPDTWQRISAAREGQFRNQYGLFTFKTISPLSEYAGVRTEKAETDPGEAPFFKILSHIPEEVLNRNFKPMFRNMLWLYGLLLILSLVGSGFFAHMREVRFQMKENQQKLIQELRQALEEVKTLQGILPICSFCKNIRNDQGYYEKLEEYFNKASGVHFSHTICPSCMEKEYPDIYQELKGNQEI